MADEDYMAAFRAVVVPLCQHFDPDIVLVSAGFDASRGHSRKLGGYIITPECEIPILDLISYSFFLFCYSSIKSISF